MPHFFGLHQGFLKAKAERIARRHGASHINYHDPNGQRRGWFECENRGEPFNSQTSYEVFTDIHRAGGLESLRYKCDREEE
jgi:hypothetical protein